MENRRRAELRVLMTHPMLTEQQSKGQPHFMQNVTVKVNGKTAIEGQISQAVSRNPVCGGCCSTRTRR